MILKSKPIKIIISVLLVLFLKENIFAEDVEITNDFTVYGVSIQYDSSLHISPAPSMPSILFEAIISPETLNIEEATFNWSFVCTFYQHGRQDERSFSATIVGDPEWEPNIGSLIAGGDCQVSLLVEIMGLELEASLGGISITGENPTNADVIAALGGSPAVEIACWESGHVLDQFDSAGWPLFGPPNGWGIMQIDNPPAACPLTEAVIWDWRENIATGLCVINAKENDARGYPSRVRRIYPNATEFTDEQLLYETIQRYNGGSYWTWGESLNPSQGQQWIATPPNDYVQNVLSTNCQ